MSYGTEQRKLAAKKQESERLLAKRKIRNAVTRGLEACF